MNRYLEKIALDVGSIAKAAVGKVGNVLKHAIGGHERQYVADNILKTTRVDKINDFVEKINGPRGKSHLSKFLVRHQNPSNFHTAKGSWRINSAIADKHLANLNDLQGKKTGARMTLGAVGIAGYAAKKKIDQHQQEQYPQTYYEPYQQ